MYWIAQTVITVGYGDIPITNKTEQFIAILAMFAGVIFFSVTIGSLTTIIKQMDMRGTVLDNKLNVLIKIRRNYKISSLIFNQIYKAVVFSVYKSEDTYEEFLKVLPLAIRIDLGDVIYSPVLRCFDEFKYEEGSLIAELGPLLKKHTF